MKYSISHTSSKLLFSGISLILILLACNPTKYVPENKHLLYSSKIEIKDRTVKADALKGYIKQKPNKRIFWYIRFHLGLYNLSNIEKGKGIHKFLRKIGEEPVIYDSSLVEKTKSQFDLYMKNKGYYNAIIDDSVYFKKKKANVIYSVKGGIPYTIRNITYSFEDSVIKKIYLADTINSVFKRGDLFDKDALQEERNRTERLLKNKGYYNFTKEYMFYNVDSSLLSHQVDMELQIRNPVSALSGNEIKHKQYKVRQVLVSQMPDPLGLTQTLPEDTINTGKGILLTDTRKLKINPRSFVQYIYVQPGKLYNESSIDETYNHVSSLNLFKMVDVKFTEVESTVDSSEYVWLDCSIRLSPSLLQSYSVDLEGTNSSGNIGGAVNLNYQNINLFGNAEVLDIKLRGAMESIKSEDKKYSRTEEYGAEANIKFPKFLIPINTENFIKKYNPKTILTLSYNHQSRPDFIRTVLNAGFGYTWKETKYKEHILRPLEINFVRIPYKSPSFDSIISGTYLESSYLDHLITNMSYSYIYNNQNLKKTRNFMFFRWNAESAGNLLSLFNSNLTYVPDSDQPYYKFLGIQYSQYLRTDFEYKYYNVITPTSNTVYRLFAGVAYPYGNARVIPFEKRYFSGGANGLRGWQVRSVGPGSDTASIGKYPNSTSDIKLEANFEYRFKLLWKLEGAFFVDAGNIWSIREEEGHPGASFRWNSFYKEFAVDTGLGIRFDFSFFIFRTDVGMKLRDPSLPSGKRWILDTRSLKGNDFEFNIGIGYPF